MSRFWSLSFLLYFTGTVTTGPLTHFYLFYYVTYHVVTYSLSLSLSHIVSFKIYDLDGDGLISTKVLTKVVTDTMGEQDVVIHKGSLFFCGMNFLKFNVDVWMYSPVPNMFKEFTFCKSKVLSSACWLEKNRKSTIMNQNVI